MDFFKVIEYIQYPPRPTCTVYQHVLQIYHLGIFIESFVNKLCRLCLSSVCVDDRSKVTGKDWRKIHRFSLILIRPTPDNEKTIKWALLYSVFNPGRPLIQWRPTQSCVPAQNVFCCLKGQGPSNNFKCLSIDTTHTPPPVPLDSTFKVFFIYAEIKFFYKIYEK